MAGASLQIDEISLNDILDKGFDNFTIIDVRSPSEYKLDNIPTSINIPILDDEERAKVGTVYKQVGTKAAKFLAVELVSPKLPEFIKKVDEASALGKEVVITCWRGGMRSGAAVTLARLAGIYSRRLTGGYAAFRKFVFEFFENFPTNINMMTLYGTTGCAKTAILERLDSMNYPVINLEKHACHKGSAFGSIAEKGYASINQKAFETSIWLDFYRNKDAKLFFVEGESQKIGKVTIPKKLHNVMRSGIKISAEAPINFRVDFTIDAYKPEDYIDDIKVSLKTIEKYIGKEKTSELINLLDERKFDEFTRFMLSSYYDPLYKNAFPKDINYTINYSSIQEGVSLCEKIYSSQVKNA